MLTGIIAVAIGLGVMVLVHEWGHFVIARLFGVRVEVFSIGFGPRLLGVKRGPTDYRISALPLGGYVRMAGDNPAEERRGDPDEFLSKPRWQRVLIALAGPTTNFLMAVVLTAALFVRGGEQPSYADKPVVVAGVVKDSPAQKAGIQAGDKVVSFAGVKDPTWERLVLELGLSAPGHSEPVTIERDGRLITTSVQSEPQPFAVVGYPAEPVIVGSVTHGSPAESAGLMESDVIVAANGEHLTAPLQLSEIVKQNGGNPMTLDILRDGQPKMLELRPTWKDPGDGTPRWQIGITFRFETSPRRYSLPQATLKATQFHIVLANKLVYLVGELFTGKVSLKQVQGPLGIVQESSRAAKRGFGDLVSLMALVSLNLAILNLLPIPILDGGHILMLGIEGLMRRDLSLKIKERFVTVGMVFLLLVFLIVMYNDVLRLFPSH
ncbi:MAG: RIP metalloprotease RseP [Acidobacteria bacterium]|nr:MAG: RIP metalloprotease RseP [Acidobacteriota bacterium]